MLAERLDKAWAARRGSGAIDPAMRFADEGLVLGAGTVLAKSDGAGRQIAIDPGEPRLLALLVAAHRRRPPPGSLAHLRKAAERWTEGQDALAATHLALSGLDRLARPESDAHRLFLADGLLNSGIEADAIIAAVETNTGDLEGLNKFNRDQPRVPAGSGRTSGEWTSGGGGAPSAQGARDTDGPAHPTQQGPVTSHAVSRPSASAPTPHRLTFTTFDGGPNDPTGWLGAFKLARPTADGGVVIQKIETTIHQSGGPVPSRRYWEFLAYIPPGATSSGRLVDDSWTPPPNPKEHGSETTTATAWFYEGLTKATLPSIFRENQKGEAGFAPVIYHDPATLLPKPSSPPLIRKGTLKY